MASSSMLRLASMLRLVSLLSVVAALQHTHFSRPPLHRATRLRAAPLADPFAATDLRPIVLYDGVCRMCNFWVDWVLANDREKNVRFCALQSDVGRALLERSGRRPDDISSIVLVTADGAHVKSDAVFEIGRRLRVTTPLSTLGQAVIPKAVADAAYDAIADNRYNIAGKRPPRFTDAKDADRFLGE
ncbi:sodium solute symporter [Aureococcus anophagefferens]|nr:sodium solute symporter [Aureococcus anophagefferens]